MTNRVFYVEMNIQHHITAENQPSKNYQSIPRNEFQFIFYSTVQQQSHTILYDKYYFDCLDIKLS